VADLTSIEFVYSICAYLPLLGMLAALLPHRAAQASAAQARAGS
jgi:hypothetical protein